MIEVLWYKFMQAWLLGLIATILGRFIGRSSVRFPEAWTARLIIFLQVWIITFLAAAAFGYAGYVLHFQEHTQAGFAEFLLPLTAGVYFCRQILKNRMSNANNDGKNTS